MKILVVTNGRKSASFLKNAFESEYNVVNVVQNTHHVLQLIRTKDYDALIIDNDDFKEDTFYLCSTSKIINQRLPIVIISSAESVTTRVSFLNSGADDFVEKPVSVEELSARLRAINRRPHKKYSDILEYDNIVLDCSRHTVLYDDTPIKLTLKEFQLLKFLIQKRGTPLSRAVILQSVWGTENEPNSNTVDLHIYKLRKKIDSQRKNSIIVTLPGRGYLIK